MRFTDIFIKRPVLAICLNLLILIGGLFSLFELNVRQYPRSDVSVVKIETAYVGADAELVRGFVTTPLERVIASADGIDYLQSSSKQGMSTITARLVLNYDVNDALTQIQSKVAQVRNDLPPEAEAPVVQVESADNQFAAVYLSFYSESLEDNQITDFLLRVVQPKLSSVAGVQKAEVLGGRTFAMRIWLKPDKLAAYGITANTVSLALQKNNYLSAIGTTKGSMTVVNLKANTSLTTAEEFKELVISQTGLATIKLKDIADVELGAENYEQEVRFSGETAKFMGVWALPNANVLDVIARVREALPEIERGLPPGMKMGIPYDSTAYITDALYEVSRTLAETILIVVVVIFIFIGSLRSVLVPVVAIPLSLIGATILMLLFGFSINLLTLLAIVLAVGLVVDDAIVMLENVERHVREGMEPKKAAVLAARELVGPTIAMTITLAAVYTPIAFQGGLTGTLFREFALTLAGAVVVSGFVALTLSPMMSSRLLKSGAEPTRLQIWVDHVLERFGAWYGRTLEWSLHNKSGILTAAALFGVLIVPLYMFAAKEPAPKEDQGVVFGIVNGAPNASLDQTASYTRTAQKIYEAVPEYERSFQLTFPTNGFSGIIPKPWSQRSRSTEEIAMSLWPQVGSIAGVQFIMITPSPLPGGGDFPVEFVISSTAEPIEIEAFAQQLVQHAFASGLFMYADTNLKFDLPQTEFKLDREKIAYLGQDLARIGNDLGSLTGGNYVNRFSIAGRSYKVIPQIKRSGRLNSDQLLDSYILAGDRTPVKVATFASVKETVEPRELVRFQQLNSATISGVIPPGVTLDSALGALETKAAEILPKNYVVDYAGESRMLRTEGSSLTVSLAMAMVVIFLVLAAQFESFRDPFIILFGSVPLALAGSLIFVFLGATTLNIYSQVGLVTLVGLVSKNGILIVEFANTLREHGMEIYEAIIKACRTRLRPILMTSVATVAGHFPLLLVSGPGAGARNSIGAVLVTGMCIGTFFTLFVVPVVYVLIASRQRSLAEDYGDIQPLPEGSH